MSSVEKQEIVQNGIFGTVLGFLSAGSVGALLAAGTALWMAAVQEDIDEQKRKRVEEITHPDPIKKQLELEEAKRKRQEVNKIYERIEKIIPATRIEVVNRYARKYYERDPEKAELVYPGIGEQMKKQLYYDQLNLMYRVDIRYSTLNFKMAAGKGRLMPESDPYVTVTIYNSREDKRNEINPISTACGIVVEPYIFERMLNNDLSNKNIKTYNLGLTNCLDTFNGSTALIHTYRYMYTVDDGFSYVVCW